jgi:Chromo (CHRromatin Organisation MOdifier) domain
MIAGSNPRTLTCERDQAYLRVEVTETGRNRKLESFVQGPYEVVENAGNTFRLRIGDETVRVSSDRVTPAPVRESPICPENRPNVSPTMPVSLPLDTDGPIPDDFTPNHGGSRSPRRVCFTLPEPDPPSEYVADRIVDAAMDEGGHVLYRTRWMGYGEGDDTWQVEETLPTHFIRRYWRKKGLTTTQGEHTLY